jgi:malonate-semialdehyde dehydrogenase (acetylating) / methylmalonate-semialdehyde dehydrogenase
MTRKLTHFIAGRHVEGKSGRFGDIFNPATGEVSAQVPLASTSEVGEAVAAAAKAFPGWAGVTPLQRSRVMFRFKALLEANIDKMAELVTAEHGKVLNDAKGSITRGVEVVEFACGIPQMLKGEFSENVGTNVDSWAIRQPLGVCAGITPFNFPAMVPMWMFPMARSPAATRSFSRFPRKTVSQLMMAELLKEAGLPDGVFNVVNGDKEAVDALLAHPDIQAISFVGSTPIAEYIYHTGTAANKRVQALGGAKNHMVVMPDADLDQTTDALMGAGYGSAGERCMAISVAVAVGDVGDKLIERLEPRIRSLKVGPGTDPDAEMGPLVTKQHFDKVKAAMSTSASRKAQSSWSTGAASSSRATRTATTSAAACSTT